MIFICRVLGELTEKSKARKDEKWQFKGARREK
jgi:hypothetical protein